MSSKEYNLLVVLGPTASGKTALAAALAHTLGGEVLSADSRQVYRGLDIGTGKDLHEYMVNGTPVPYHLIDIADVDQECSVFEYQEAFFQAFADIQERGKLPILSGGSGMYLDAVCSKYDLRPTPINPELRQVLESVSDDALQERLYALKEGRIHNTTDLGNRGRLVRAIEIAAYAREHPPPPRPEIRPCILGIAIPPDELRKRIALRLQARLDMGMIDEVRQLHDSGCSWERLQQLGLEYKYLAMFLQGGIPTREMLFQQLCVAIAQFAKRQRTWFRGMERRGKVIHWIPRPELALALQILRQHHE